VNDAETMSQFLEWNGISLKDVAARHLSVAQMTLRDADGNDVASDVVVFDDLSGWYSAKVEEVMARAMSTEVHSEKTVKFAAQYLPADGRGWTDLKEKDTEEDAALAIHQNIDEWDKIPERRQSKRPSWYRIVRREVTETVMLETADDRGVASDEDVRAALTAHPEAWHGELAPLEKHRE